MQNRRKPVTADFAVQCVWWYFAVAIPNPKDPPSALNLKFVLRPSAFSHVAVLIEMSSSGHPSLRRSANAKLPKTSIVAPNNTKSCDVVPLSIQLEVGIWVKGYQRLFLPRPDKLR
jgi:hypothetical protein